MSEDSNNKGRKKLLKEKKKERKEQEEKLKALEYIIEDTSAISYNSECVRKKSNWGKSMNEYKFDDYDFQPGILLKNIPHSSPKLHELLQKIKDLDKKDKKEHGKLFKHFIFSDLKFGAYGAKLIASALIADGYHLGYTAEPTAEGSKKKYNKIELHSDEVLKKTSKENFYILSSVGVYDQGITVKMKKDMLQKFNQRPENIYGDLVRFIILDSGFKEGIDLFDVKYVHIFEPSVYLADQKQVIGRSTRTCGQKGIEFHPIYGWPLDVFIYDHSIPEKIQGSLLNSKTTMELFLKSMNIDMRLLNFSHDLEKATILGAVDYDLNKNVHSFSIPFISGKEDKKNHEMELSEHIDKEVELVYGGAKKSKLRELILNPPELAIVPMQQPKRLKYDDMREFVRENFSDFAWEKVKMENLCDDKKKGGAGDVIKFTPTQDFVRHYFHPWNPIKGMLLYHSVGTGKCHAKDTPILMHDGTIKKVQDVLVGDKLMGDDSKPREVLSLANGKDDMYDIIPVKGEKYRVNSEHILCLKYSGKGAITNCYKSQPNLPFKTTMINNKTFKIMSKSFKTREEAEDYLNCFKEEDRIIEIEVTDYLKLPESLKRDLKGYRKGVDFDVKDVFDPYIMGLWLGDGSSRGSVFSSQDSKILKYLRDNSKKYGLLLNYQSKYDYRWSKDGTTDTNYFIDVLNKYNLINNKHIPYEYKCNSRENRLKLLAGLLDTDGSYCKRGKIFNISQKSDTLANDILFLARSLGYAAYSKTTKKSCVYKGEKKIGYYNCITISGNNLDEIPTLLTRKRAEKRLQIKDVLSTGITVQHAGKGDYYGFCIDGNRRYLIGDFTVTHNTCSAIAAATSNFEKNGYTILWVTRTTLKNDIWKNMFDQVCNDSIRNQIENQNLQIPGEQSKRMRLLSKAWKIRPMSYKQFSNLILKQNVFYENLVKINGKEDPLRKTLLIIDEAHKLYGGDDLSSIEKPDMNALKKALMYSYQYSGQESVRLLLMTATPITKDPMELIELINLCKPPDEQMPSDFSNFAKEYLDDNGDFTSEGRMKYLDDIAGYVSYLNREKDARQFAQPQIHHVQTPIVSDIKNVELFDKKVMKDVLEAELNTEELRAQVEEEGKKIKGELANINAGKLGFLKEDICGDLSGKVKSECTKVVNKGIKELVKEAKEYAKEIKSKIKELNTLMKERKKAKGHALKDIRDNIKKYDTDYEKYQESILYQLKSKCAKKVNTEDRLKENLENHPLIKKDNMKIEDYNQEIKKLEDELKMLTENYKARMKYLRKMLKTDLNPLERSVINSAIRDERKEYNKMIRLKKRDTNKSLKLIKNNIKVVEKNKTKRRNKIKTKIKDTIKNQKKQVREIKNETNKLRKAIRSRKSIMKHEYLKELINKYRGNILENISELKEKNIEKEKEKEELKEKKKQEVQKNRETRKFEKEKEKAEKKKEKDVEKEKKKQEVQKNRETRKIEQEKIKAEKKKEKEEKKQKEKESRRLEKEKKQQEKNARKTRKNNS